MNDLVAIGEALTAVGFLLLAVVAVVRGARTGPSGWWAAAAFGALGMALAAFWLPDWVGFELPGQTDGIQLLLVLGFPYLLLRFTATFRPLPRSVEVAAAAGALVTAAVTLFPLTRAVGAGTQAESLQVAAIFVYWAGVSLIAAGILWRAGDGQPGVARRRIRLMAGATAFLTAALITGISFDDGSQLASLAGNLLALASAVAFLLGLSPPRSLRLSWRAEEDRALQSATADLLRSDTIDEVAASLLGPTVRIMGGSGAAIVGADDEVVASHGQAPDVGQRLAPAGVDGEPTREEAALGKAGRRLVVWTSAYTPFFGPEELGLFRSMAAIGGLALDRCGLIAEEREQRSAMEQARETADSARADAEAARRDADEANLAKSEFLSRMSHELRTPLNAVLGFGQLLQTSPGLAEDDQESVDYILKAGRHLLALINDVLDLSRIEAGTLAISVEPVHVGELLEETLSLVRPMASERSIRIETAHDLGEQYVVTDRQRCRQVLLNLLSNAIKYNRDGGRVTVSCSQPGPDQLRIAVSDTGPGIEPGRLQRLFEPFDRLGAESSTVEGTGLGLALTKQLIERLGGSIGVDTAPGDGSTFWVDLATTDAPESPTTTPSRPPEVGDSPHERTLLLVEDNLANLRVVEAMLRRRPGISVLPAMQGTLALELAHQHQPDVIVLDLHLPDLPGREVLTRLKADPNTRDIPVLVASADATPGRVRQLIEDGAVEYVTKPLDLERFLGAVDRALNGTTDTTDPTR